MGKTITKEIDGCENCLFAKDHTCMLLGYVDIATDDFGYDAFVNIYYDIQKDKIGIVLEELLSLLRI
ncbi:hypothetical protein OFS03_07485 [Brachyspira hyodysenteriae]|nr:hypothetical protein [Brachyspira hyodysenteriae]MDA0063058.1 hypothetical protein [Brachyspira hyodysenteriae]